MGCRRWLSAEVGRGGDICDAYFCVSSRHLSLKGGGQGRKRDQADLKEGLEGRLVGIQG